MKKRLIATLLVLCIVLGVLPGTAQATASTSHGTCGDNLTWTLDEEGTLTISGTGDMENYIGNNFSPWNNVRFSIKAVKIAVGVTSVGNSAFLGSNNLRSVTIPQSVKSIGEYAFSSCTGLTGITIPDSVTSIGKGAFIGCSSLTSVHLPNRITCMEDFMFRECSKLANITIPNSVTSIGLQVFQDCSSLSSIVIPEGVTNITAGTFWNCSSLTSITLPRSLLTIDGEFAFADCSNLTNITIPEGVTFIAGRSFISCSKLNKVVIPGSVTTMGYEVFNQCNELKTAGPVGSGCNYEFGWTDKIPDYAFEGCGGLTSITIPDSITNIGTNAFAGCSSLTSVTIPQSATRIGSQAFIGCTSLTSVTIPNSVTSIDRAAFHDCTALTDVYYSGTKAQWDEISIEDYNDPLINATIHYNRTEYSFTYSLDGGSWSLPDECYPYSAGEKITIPSEMPLKDGCYFAGWSDGVKTYQPGSTYTMPSYNVELTALWGMGPLNLISIARDNITVTESYTAAPRYTLADGATVEWTSANPSIAAVDSNGVVTGVHYGKTTIMAVATAAGAKQTVSYPVTVNRNCKITFTNAVVNLAQGKSTDLDYTVLPREWKQYVKLQSSDSSIVSVSGNTITAVGKGTATITGSFDFGSIGSAIGAGVQGVCTVTVSNGEELAQLFVNEALKYVGYSESEFERTTKSTVSNGNWCSDFIGVCAKLVGAEKALPRESAGYKLSSRIVDKGGCVVDTPQKGDIITFRSSSGYGHVGIVCDVDANTVYVVHGNWHSHVCAPDGYGANNQNCIKYSTGKSKSCGKWNIKTKQGPGATIDLYTRPNWNIDADIKCGILECRINCPVDIRFAYDGEVLDSATEQFEASFGTMERTDGDGLLVHLNNYYNDMDVTINGTGVGTMDITSTFRDSDGTTSTRKFQGVPITEETIGKLFVYDSAATEILEIYKDNGNTFVEVWAADGNTTVSSADKDLTDWYLNGDTSDVEPDIPITPAPTYPTGSSIDGNSSSTTRGITVPSFKGGTVTVSPKSASKGATVILTATPDKGYDLSSITVSDSKGNELELTDKGNNKYTFIMPASAVTVNAVFEKIEPAENTPIDGTYLFPFTDVLRTDWFCNAVEYVFTNDLMSGIAPYTFDPQGKMNRAMVWTVLGRMADADVDGSESPWYSKAQTWALSNNVSDGTNPTNSISRQELMTMLWRYIGSPAATADLNKFSDSESVADWADDAMQWAVSTGLIVGDNGRLNPTGDARRCEVAMIFMRYCENSAE